MTFCPPYTEPAAGLPWHRAGALVPGQKGIYHVPEDSCSCSSCSFNSSTGHPTGQCKGVVIHPGRHDLLASLPGLDTKDAGHRPGCADHLFRLRSDPRPEWRGQGIRHGSEWPDHLARCRANGRSQWALGGQWTHGRSQRILGRQGSHGRSQRLRTVRGWVRRTLAVPRPFSPLPTTEVSPWR